MTTPDPSGEGRSDVVLRDQLSGLQALLALSMRMTDSNDETQILRLASTAVPSLGRCRMVGAHLSDDGWHPPPESPGAGATAVRGRCRAGRPGRHGRSDRRRRRGVGVGVPAAQPRPPPRLPRRQRRRRAVTPRAVRAPSARPTDRDRPRQRPPSQPRAASRGPEVLDANSRLAATVAALEHSTTIHDRLTRVRRQRRGSAGHRRGAARADRVRGGPRGSLRQPAGVGRAAPSRPIPEGVGGATGSRRPPCPRGSGTHPPRWSPGRGDPRPRRRRRPLALVDPHEVSGDDAGRPRARRHGAGDGARPALEHRRDRVETAARPRGRAARGDRRGERRRPRRGARLRP